MTDPMIFYSGMFCFGMTLVGLLFTFWEFRKF